MPQQNFAEDFVPKLAQNFTPNGPPPKSKLRPKLRPAETLSLLEISLLHHTFRASISPVSLPPNQAQYRVPPVTSDHYENSSLRIFLRNSGEGICNPQILGSSASKCHFQSVIFQWGISQATGSSLGPSPCTRVKMTLVRSSHTQQHKGNQASFS